VRARGWLTGDVPDAPTLVRLANLAFFEGVAMLLDDPAPTVARSAGSLVLTFFRAWHPSHSRTQVEITVGPLGKATVESK
jgi:hypothetical protein